MNIFEITFSNKVTYTKVAIGPREAVILAYTNLIDLGIPIDSTDIICIKNTENNKIYVVKILITEEQNEFNLIT